MLPTSGPLSLGDIRTELGMSGAINFSLIKASTSTIPPGYPGYPQYLDSVSFVPPQPSSITSSPYSIGDWRGYSSATIRWYNNANTSGKSRLLIYVNGSLAVDNDNNFDPIRTGSLSIYNNDTFYATMIPITYTLTPPIAYINIYQYLSPFGPFNYIPINSTSGSSGTFTSFFSPTQTATIQPVNLAVFEIDTIC